MKRQGKVSLVVGSVLIAYFSSAAMADPVSMNDLVGKKICWVVRAGSVIPPVVSSTTTYYAGGKYYSTVWGAGTFAAIPQGIHVDSEKGSFDTQLEKLSGGTFRSTMVSSGQKYISTGKYCK